MDGREVIEDIDFIYEKFKTPSHLQEHMRRAAAVARFICEHWTGEKINPDDVIAMLLLHDLGNVVRMTFDNPDLVSLYSEKSNVEDLKLVKEWAISQYGEDDHNATRRMCDEIGISERIMSLMERHGFINNRGICVTDDMELKIAAYSDQRIGPRGVLNLRVRLLEAAARASKRPWYNEFDMLLDCALKIEEQVLAKTTLSEEEINDCAINHYLNHINS